MALMPISQIKCPVDIKDYPQYEGFEQYQQIIAIEVPVVYDQCLLKKCLMDTNDPRLAGTTPVCPPGSYTKVSGLKATLTNIPKNTQLNFRAFRNFDIIITNISSSKISPTQNSVTVTYEIKFKADVLVGDSNETINIDLLNLKETTVLNCPESLSQISVSTGSTGVSVNEPIFKLAMVPDLANSTAYFITTPVGGSDKVNVDIFFNLCYGLMVKCELESQVLIPFYGFFNDGKTCTNNQENCPCVQCLKSSTGTFYPPINFSVFQCGASAAVDANVVANPVIVTPEA